jgi:hypothetical protein
MGLSGFRAQASNKVAGMLADERSVCGIHGTTFGSSLTSFAVEERFPPARE